MVVRSDRTLRDTERIGQTGPGEHGDLVIDSTAWAARRVAVHQQTRTIGDVLIEGATERHVEHLMTSADREHRTARIERSLDQLDLERVHRRVDAIRRGMGGLAVPGRVDVGPAGQNEPGKRLEYLAGA